MRAPVLAGFPHRNGLLLSPGISVWLSAAAALALADHVSVDCGLGILREGANAVVFWQLPPEHGQGLLLQNAGNAGGPWSTMMNTPPPLIVRMEEGRGRFFRAELAIPTGAADAARIAQAVRGFAFSSISNLNPATEFDIRVMPVGGLWEAVQMQVVNVRCLSGGQPFNEFACGLHRGTARTLGLSSGGHGLMSGLTQNRIFYFSYSWGSGVHRSHLGKLQLVNEELKCWDAGGFANVDLFLARRPDGEIAVVSGRFDGFNRWSEPRDYGRIDGTDASATRLMGLDASVLATFVPTDLGQSGAAPDDCSAVPLGIPGKVEPIGVLEDRHRVQKSLTH